MSEEEILDLTYYELDEYMKCITQEVYDKSHFEAKLHGAKMKSRKNFRRVPSYDNKKKDLERDKLDSHAEKMFERMKSQKKDYGKYTPKTKIR